MFRTWRLQSYKWTYQNMLTYVYFQHYFRGLILVFHLGNINVPHCQQLACFDKPWRRGAMVLLSCSSFCLIVFHTSCMYESYKWSLGFFCQQHWIFRKCSKCRDIHSNFSEATDFTAIWRCSNTKVGGWIRKRTLNEKSHHASDQCQICK
jgi:hypothetical protein